MGRQTLSLKTGFLREFMVDLKRLAKEHRCGLVFTSQVSETPDAGPYTSKADTQHPLGGHSVAHQPDYVIFFRKGSGNIRVCRMIDSSHKPLAERPFVINEKGIDNLPPEAKAAKSYDKGTEKFDERQHQEELRSKKKDETEENSEIEEEEFE
jgi:hypothetical protein